jgi:Uma2 family endonuclease
MTAQPQPQVGLSPEEYLARERRAEIKSEYHDGEVFAVSGASRAHNLIVTNFVRELSLRLRDRGCEVYPSDMRVKVDPTGLYTYPDVIVVCGEPAFEDEHVDTLLNPTLLIEVLSESTEAYDRGKKFEHYRKIDTVQGVVLVAQDEARAERFTRQPDGQWLLGEASGLEAALHLASIDVTLPLADIYDKVSFENEEIEE